jgi:hypothetical protein
MTSLRILRAVTNRTEWKAFCKQVGARPVVIPQSEFETMHSLYMSSLQIRTTIATRSKHLFGGGITFRVGGQKMDPNSATLVSRIISGVMKNYEQRSFMYGVQAITLSQDGPENRDGRSVDIEFVILNDGTKKYGVFVRKGLPGMNGGPGDVNAASSSTAGAYTFDAFAAEKRKQEAKKLRKLRRKLKKSATSSTLASATTSAVATDPTNATSLPFDFSTNGTAAGAVGSSNGTSSAPVARSSNPRRKRRTGKQRRRATPTTETSDTVNGKEKNASSDSSSDDSDSLPDSDQPSLLDLGYVNPTELGPTFVVEEAEPDPVTGMLNPTMKTLFLSEAARSTFLLSSLVASGKAANPTLYTVGIEATPQQRQNDMSFYTPNDVTNTRLAAIETHQDRSRQAHQAYLDTVSAESRAIADAESKQAASDLFGGSTSQTMNLSNVFRHMSRPGNPTIPIDKGRTGFLGPPAQESRHLIDFMLFHSTDVGRAGGVPAVLAGEANHSAAVNQAVMHLFGGTLSERREVCSTIIQHMFSQFWGEGLFENMIREFYSLNVEERTIETFRKLSQKSVITVSFPGLMDPVMNDALLQNFAIRTSTYVRSASAYTGLSLDDMDIEGLDEYQRLRMLEMKLRVDALRVANTQTAAATEGIKQDTKLAASEAKDDKKDEKKSSSSPAKKKPSSAAATTNPAPKPTRLTGAGSKQKTSTDAPNNNNYKTSLAPELAVRGTGVMNRQGVANSHNRVQTRSSKAK